MSYAPITTSEDLANAISRVRQAQSIFAEYTQEQVDRIFLAAATAANRALGDRAPENLGVS